MYDTFTLDDKVEIGFILRSRGPSHVAEVLERVRQDLEEGTTVVVKSRNGNYTYNGWASRETWALCLQFDNDQGLYEGLLERLRGEADEPTFETNAAEALSVREAGSVVKVYAEGLLTVDGWIDETGYDSLPAELSRIAEDIGSLYRVDWDEVGQHYLNALAESIEDDDHEPCDECEESVPTTGPVQGPAHAESCSLYERSPLFEVVAEAVVLFEH